MSWVAGHSTRLVSQPTSTISVCPPVIMRHIPVPISLPSNEHYGVVKNSQVPYLPRFARLCVGTGMNNDPKISSIYTYLWLNRRLNAKRLLGVCANNGARPCIIPCGVGTNHPQIHLLYGTVVVGSLKFNRVRPALLIIDTGTRDLCYFSYYFTHYGTLRIAVLYLSMVLRLSYRYCEVLSGLLLPAWPMGGLAQTMGHTRGYRSCVILIMACGEGIFPSPRFISDGNTIPRHSPPPTDRAPLPSPYCTAHTPCTGLLQPRS